MDPSAANAPLLDHEREWLLRAVELAERGRGRVRPNPMVGCVLVRDGAIVGEGWHEEFGEAHAEVNALDAARGKAVGATAYVTLHPVRTLSWMPVCDGSCMARPTLGPKRLEDVAVSRWQEWKSLARPRIRPSDAMRIQRFFTLRSTAVCTSPSSWR